MNCRIVATVLTLAAGLHLAAGAEANKPLPKRYWKPIKDEVYLQEVGWKITHCPLPVKAVVAHNGTVYIGGDTGLYRLKDTIAPVDPGNAVEQVGPTGEAVRTLKVLDGVLWMITDKSLHCLRGDTWVRVAEGDFSDVCTHRGRVCVAGGRALYQVEGDTLAPIPGADRCPAIIVAVASYSETLYILGHDRMVLFDGKRYDDINVIDWGALPSKDTRCMLAQGSRLYVGTDRGIGLLRGMGMTPIRGEQGLCYEDVTSITEGAEQDLWIGTAEGAIRHVNGEFQYFAAARWLPGNRVYDIAVDRTPRADGLEYVVYIATDKGLGVIGYEPYTLLKKAAYYETHLVEWGQKRLGFTHKLEWSHDLKKWVREVSDNDVGWSTHYLGAQCFRYAVTGEEEARAEAVNYFNSMKWSEEISSIDGFPARSIWAVGEEGNKAQGGSGGYPAEWHPTPDGKWHWKGDTSSDETDGHFYAASIFHELVARGEEKARVVEHVDRIATHIIDNGWTLRDVDGKPTRWARWDPEYFHSYSGMYARGLNGLEILMYMRTAQRITGDAKYDKAIDTLIGMHYLDKILRQKLVFPPDDVFHSDDRLAFYAYYPLLKYETDPDLRSLYMRSLERSWEVERIEHIPWFNFIYGALTGNDCETEQAVGHLREYPLDCLNYAYRHSIRHDLHTPDGYVTYSGGVKAISPRERNPKRWASTTLRLDGGGSNSVADPSSWIETYWMGRYYGFIEAPETDDPALTTVPFKGIRSDVTPYQGPPRPE
ncbi:MAG: hypothetical protein GY851_04115 [bacterium]|nr:hypothetical protein [bacterium]